MTIEARINRLERRRPDPPPPIVVKMPRRDGDGCRYLVDGKEVTEDELPEPNTMLVVEYV